MSDPIDLHVGERLRLRRLHLGLSQSQVAAVVGCSFQQIQKYENGLNRVSASRLVYLATALKVDVTFFFDGVPQVGRSAGSVSNAELELLGLWRQIPPRVQAQALSLLRVGVF